MTIFILGVLLTISLSTLAIRESVWHSRLMNCQFDSVEKQIELSKKNLESIHRWASDIQIYKRALEIGEETLIQQIPDYHFLYDDCDPEWKKEYWIEQAKKEIE